jgi:hypothetical protein
MKTLVAFLHLYCLLPVSKAKFAVVNVHMMLNSEVDPDDTNAVAMNKDTATSVRTHTEKNSNWLRLPHWPHNMQQRRLMDLACSFGK